MTTSPKLGDLSPPGAKSPGYKKQNPPSWVRRTNHCPPFPLFFLALFPVPCSPFPASIAFAHQNAHPKIDAIVIERNVLRVEVQYDMSPGDEPRNLRKLYDADQNGQIDAAESEKLLDYLELTCASLVVRLDEKKLTTKRTSRSGKQIEGITDRASEINFSAAFEVKIELSAGLHAIEFAERGMFGVVPIAVRFASPLVLVTASQTPLDFAANRVGPAHIGNQEKLSVIFVVP